MFEDGEGPSVLGNMTGALMMIDKKERKLLREVLSLTMNSKSGRAYIIKKFGDEYIGVAEKLLLELGDT